MPVFSALRQAGIVKPCASSPCRSPMFPVKKVRDAGEPEEWRFCQDLQRVNSAVQPRAPSVPNPCTVLSQIPQDSSWYSVCDLSNAFFSIRIHEDSQFWFAFEFLGQTWTFSRLCQGFCTSPTIFNAAMRESLSGLVLPPDTTLCQYMDDLLIASKTREECEEATIALLKHLAEQGHKASLKKLQFVQQTVTFLGHVISAGSRAISSKRVSAIQNIPRPRTKKQLMSFLGTTSYCRNFIPNYSIMEAPLSALSHGKGLRPGDAISWNEDAERAFVDLKLALQTAPTLGLPDPEKPFVQAVDERNGSMTSVLLQTHGGTSGNPSVTSNTTSPKVYVYRETDFTVGSNVDLTCSNKTWSDLIFVIWDIKLKHRAETCRISGSNLGKSGDTCNDGKTLQNTSSVQPYLHIPNFSADDVGIYTCESVYRGGNENYVITVTATVPPKISAWLEFKHNKTVAVCSAEGGNPAANISWTHTGNTTVLTVKHETEGYFTVDSTLELPDTKIPENLTCVISHKSWEEDRTLVPKFKEGQFSTNGTEQDGKILDYSSFPWIRVIVVIVFLGGFLLYAVKKPIKLRWKK
ncbi:uncharacterized protein si:ch211-214p13.9 isoform X2 [Melanotaenia boesemani]|uniref:uncharacterized protein si:ch211-214p13.9 isoform X2 n=1 Tax=Melanotaenia boesemani TaxID=1250792 RepID=UPI001C0443E7|nr:uncharacterized protein si:ch211-214p13.9 isoform X2 [Melanotaenia boesemani]